MDRKALIGVVAVAVVVVGFFLFRLVSNNGDEEAIATTTLGTTTTEPGESTATSPSETTATASGVTTTTQPADGGFPVVIDAPNGPVTIEKKPMRIVSISPTSTEVLFAVGAGVQVVAVDDQSNFPANAPVTDLTGFTPNVEAIASYDPDLVLLSFDPGDVIGGLEALGIPVIMHPTAVSVGDAYTQWEQVGAATGNVPGAADVVAETQMSMSSAVETLPEGTDALTFYYELDPTFYSATSSSFIGGLFELTGMSNIADAADPDGFGFPQLTAEYIIGENPSLIFLADTICCGQTTETVADRPGWSALDAVMSDAVVELDDDVASRWGPRIADLVDDIVVSILDLELVDA